TPVDTETVTVTGNGTYTTPTGFTLPTTGTVAGTYQWDATYSGDSNNNPVSDTNAANERVTVGAASPAISTTPSPSTGLFGKTWPAWPAAITRPARSPSGCTRRGWTRPLARRRTRRTSRGSTATARTGPPRALWRMRRISGTGSPLITATRTTARCPAVPWMS